MTSWWSDAVVYQIYPRSFADSDGDGLGDLRGATEKLPYLKNLGVDAVWLSPFYPSPQRDGGYDVSDYRDVDPRFGTLADFDAFVERAHDLGLKVIVDIVPNHSSADHPFFRAALAAAPGSPERARYVFRDGQGPGGEEPPNNWTSIFHGPAWSRITEADGTPGQWYLHLFDTTQPDRDWTNPAVHQMFREILRFWLDRGVDGFRVDVAHGMVKAEGLPDAERNAEGMIEFSADYTPPYFDQDGVHDIYREWRTVLDEYEERMMVAEAWVPEDRILRYVREGELHQAFNFTYLEAAWRAADLRGCIEESLCDAERSGTATTWVLSNHDVVRHATRFGYDRDRKRPEGIGPRDAQPDGALGLARARAATLLMLALPGSAYLYNGEELGLPDATQLPDEVRQDPAHARSGGEAAGRDGCRVPIPWVATAPGFGFSPTGKTWLPQPDSYARYAADVQDGIEHSTLELYRDALRLRREHGLGSGHVEWLDAAPPDVVALRNGSVTVLANTSDEPQAVTLTGRVLAASGPLGGSGRSDQAGLPANTTVWLATEES